MKRIINNLLAAILITASIVSCQAPISTNEQQQKPETKPTIASKQTDKQSQAKAADILPSVDLEAQSAANFIAGIPSDYNINEHTQKDFYKQHSKLVDEAWAKIETNNLLPIRTWRRDTEITDPSDTLTMIYPLSGPDILYANSFFPYCKNYIMIGLEHAGSLPKLKNVPDNVLKSYLEGIRHSLRYINSKGYFVTSQMQKDLHSNKLDGTIHILLYYLARTGHSISGLSEFYLDQFGKAQTPTTDHIYQNEIRGVNIRFFHPDRKYEQSLYYFPFDLSDTNVAKKSEFLYFVNSFGPKVFYTKSASYILHDSRFSTIRKLLLNQSQKILQDDTGIPYFLLDKGNYRLTLFGDYTRTINDFDKHFQPRLKKALDARSTPLYLPFKIGYNAWFNETVLIYGQAISTADKQELLAQRKAWREQSPTAAKASKVGTQKDPELKNSKGILFRVQFLYSDKKFEPSHPALRGLTKVGYYTAKGKIRYTIGNAHTIAELATFKKIAANKGFKDAFVVAFSNGKRISITEAQELATKK